MMHWERAKVKTKAKANEIIPMTVLDMPWLGTQPKELSSKRKGQRAARTRMGQHSGPVRSRVEGHEESKDRRAVVKDSKDSAGHASNGDTANGTAQREAKVQTRWGRASCRTLQDIRQETRR